ncbi:ectoine/hydroxyectoine ABC transporter substrate-binding protein EhuB [Halomonas sp. EGI 63088]|uniref:Ectoine/hydroxyectoine ABC transporter substrate-binding protein EhuB n=1 Tax=Halomonas flagellata TaxID=2920385 RepID=A0ABS9RUR5_9GAMM|nr:ectoine/hydroxyectoine ABC transporter substrate-binding protein EhuB [Halomonas flagellata]MCH4563550.1 ectoine/hydroxyectoine ABC transporter substrate-binding protein EhuB [Halomonas flagellata]
MRNDSRTGWPMRLAITALLFGLAGADTSAATLEEIRERGSIRIAVANEVPYGYIDEHGEPRGAGPEVALRLMDELGIESIEWIETSFGDLIPGLEEGRFDMAAAEMAIRPSRCERVLFSAPNTSYGEGLLVRAANPLEIAGYADFAERDDIRVAVLEGATQVGIMQALGVPDDQVIQIGENEAAIDTLLGGKVDAYAGTGLTVSQLDAQDSKVEVVQNFEDPVIDGEIVRSWGAFTFPPDAETLRDAFDEVLLDYRNTQEWEDTLAGYGFTQDDILNAFRFDTEWLCSREE